jgi:transcription termination factor NusB
MPQSGRRLAREAVLKGLYALEIGVLPADEVLKNVVLDDGLSDSTAEYALALFERTREGQSVTDSHISRLARNWELERIAVIDRIQIGRASCRERVFRAV